MNCFQAPEGSQTSMNTATSDGIGDAGDAPTLIGVLRQSLRRPYRLVIRRWNWKSALMSSLVRSLLFFFVNLSVGTAAAAAAFATEFVFRGCTAGFYGAVTQNMSRVRPAWQGSLGALLLPPILNHSGEFLVHWLRGTANLEASICASMCFTALSSTFHVSVMRRGLLVVGEGSAPLGSDLRQMPVAVALFVAAPFIRLHRMFGSGGTVPKPSPVSEF